MKINAIVTVFFLLFSVEVSAQGEVNFKEVDSSTYALYNTKQWEKLLKEGKRGLKKGIDYYYLRMRMGIARYRQEKPFFAAAHFEKALKFSHNDPAALTYLYNSYLWENNRSKAARLSAGFTPALKESLNVETKTFQGFDVSSGYQFNDNVEKNGGLYIMGADSLTGKQLLLGKQLFFHAGASLLFFDRLNVYMSYDNLHIDKTTRFQYRELRLKKDSTVLKTWGYENYFSETSTVKEKIFDDAILQHDFYINANLRFNRGWSAGGFYHFINVGSTKVNAIYSQSSKTDTAYYIEYQKYYETFEYKQDSFRFETADTSYNNWFTGVFAEKDWNFLRVSFELAAGNLNGFKQKQASMGLIYYPFGNTSLYGKTVVSFFKQSKEQEPRFLWSQTAGIKISPGIWFEAGYRQGDFSDAQFERGFLVYNLPEKIEYSANASLFFFLNKSVNVNLRYQHFYKTGKYGFFQKESNDFGINEFNYLSNTIIVELIWKF
jgi:hypothetical protein